MSDKKLSANEYIKTRSNYLRGTIQEGLADPSTGSMSEDDQQLLKFHGTYQQDDRDIRAERRKQKLDQAYSFMIRIRVPGGVATPQQWLETDRLATQFANGTIKLTTRQAFQFHGVIKSQPQAHDRRDQPVRHGHHRRLRRREPQRDVQSESRICRKSTREASRRRRTSPRTSRRRPAPITRSGWTARRSRSSEEEDRADLRQDLPAAEVQDRHRRAAVQRRRHLRALTSASSPSSRTASSSATTSPSAAAWA